MGGASPLRGEVSLRDRDAKCCSDQSDFPSRQFDGNARTFIFSFFPFYSFSYFVAVPKKATRRFPETLCACLRARTRLFLENSVESLPKRDQYLRDELRKKRPPRSACPLMARVPQFEIVRSLFFTCSPASLHATTPGISEGGKH